MATLAELVVKVSTDTRNAVKGIEGFRKGVDKAGKKLTKGLTLPVLAAGAGMFKLFADAEQAIGGTEAVFGDLAEQIDRVAQTSDVKLGLSETAFRQATSAIGGQLKRMTGDTQFAADEAIRLTGIGADLAATFGGTTRQAVEALGSALRGEADPVERFGVNLSATAVQTKATELGLGDVQTGTAKYTKALLALLDEQVKSTGALGQFEREAGTAQGRMERLRARAENLAVSFGTRLLPVGERLLNFASGLLDRFEALDEDTQDLIIVSAGLAAALGPLLKTVAAGIQIVGGLSKALIFLAANPVVLLIGLLALIAVGLVKAYQESETFRKIVNDAFRHIGRVIGRFAIFAIERFQDILDFWVGILDGILSAAIRVFDLIAPNVADKLRNARDKVRNFREQANQQLDRVKKAVETTFVARTGGAENRIQKLREQLGRFPTRFELSMNLRPDGIGLGVPGTGAGTLMGISPTSAVGSAYTALGRPGDVISGFRQGARTLTGNLSYHAQGRALDITPSLGTALAIRRQFSSRTKELITPWPGLNLLNGFPHQYSDAIQAQHDGRTGVRHIHWAMRHGAAFLRRTVLTGPISIAENHPEVVAPEPMLRGILREELMGIGQMRQRIEIDVTGTDEEMKRLIRKLFRTGGLAVT